MPAAVRAQLDYYAVLEIAPTADTVEVNAAFRRLAWRYHPDRNPAPGATVQFQDINEAHQVLSDRSRRADYDAQWHPRVGDQPRQVPTPHRNYRARRRWHRHRHLRAVLLGLGAMLFVSSAWAVIFTAMTAAHSGGHTYAYDASVPSLARGATSCSFSMEMFPVTYVDSRGRTTTSWGTEVRNCYGGSTRIFAAPPPRIARTGRFANDPEVR
jgi:curved DNA-binding protein CbpA